MPTRKQLWKQCEWEREFTFINSYGNRQFKTLEQMTNENNQPQSQQTPSESALEKIFEDFLSIESLIIQRAKEKLNYGSCSLIGYIAYNTYIEVKLDEDYRYGDQHTVDLSIKELAMSEDDWSKYLAEIEESKRLEKLAEIEKAHKKSIADKENLLQKLKKELGHE